MSNTSDAGYPLIIDSPELQARHKRVVYSAATLVAWSLWMYLWLPLVSLLAWWFGVRVFAREILVPDGGTVLLTLAGYALVVAALALALVVWSQYNLRRFGPRGRRRAPPAVSDAEIAAWFGVAESDLPAIRSAATQTVRFRRRDGIEFVPRAARTDAT